MRTLSVSEIDESTAAALPWEKPVQLNVEASGLSIPLLVVRRQGAERVVVLNNDAIDQELAQGLPVFQRSTWWQRIAHHQIYVCDPATVGDHATSLAWGNISETIWTPPSISQAVSAVSRALGVEASSRRLYYGSGGGGFMALALHGEDEGSSAVVDNALFDWTRGAPETVDLLRSKRFDNLLPDEIRDRWRLTADVLARLADRQVHIHCDYHVNLEAGEETIAALTAMDAFMKGHPSLSSGIRIFRHAEPARGAQPLDGAETIAAIDARFLWDSPGLTDGSSGGAAAPVKPTPALRKRVIRFKEHIPLSYKSFTPSDAYRRTTDHTLGTGPFIARADVDGFLRTGNDTAHDCPKVILLGGSFVESMFVPENIRFASILERRLSVAGHPRRVLNGGYSGNNTLQITQSVISKLPAIVDSDTIVLLCIGQSDAEVLLTTGTYWSPQPRIAPIQPPSPTASFFDEPAEETLRRVTSLAISSALTLGLRTGIIVAGFRDGDFSFDPVLRSTHRRNRAAYERTVETRRMIQRVGSELAREAGVPTFDAHRATLNGSPELYYDNMHLNERGQEVMAAALERWLIDEFLEL